MFRDTQEELKRLEEELLEEESERSEEDELLEDIAQLLGDEPEDVTPDQVYNSDNVDEDPEELSEEILAPRKENLRGLMISALLLTIAILGLLIFWVLRLRV